MQNCSTCQKLMQVRCPCERAECTLVTDVSCCPTCEPTKFAKSQKAHGMKVCKVYVERELGLDEDL